MRTSEELDDIIDKVKRNDIVCDSINRCKGWEQSYEQIMEMIEDSAYEYTGLPFRFCPFCGSKIIWKDKP